MAIWMCTEPPGTPFLPPGLLRGRNQLSNFHNRPRPYVKIAHALFRCGVLGGGPEALSLSQCCSPLHAPDLILERNCRPNDFPNHPKVGIGVERDGEGKAWTRGCVAKQKGGRGSRLQDKPRQGPPWQQPRPCLQAGPDYNTKRGSPGDLQV